MQNEIDKNMVSFLKLEIHRPRNKEKQENICRKYRIKTKAKKKVLSSLRRRKMSNGENDAE